MVVGSNDDLRVVPGQARVLAARLGPCALREPVRVVAVVDEPHRRGFAYGTRTGHPVSGEEAFIVHRTADGEVWLTLRSLTRPVGVVGGWTFPLARLAQLGYRARSRRALRSGSGVRSHRGTTG